MRGSILRINLRQQCSDVKGEDGCVRSFSRDAMVRWLQFLELKPGDPVNYEVDHTGAVINVERFDLRRSPKPEAARHRQTRDPR
jgi:hypothetical protein